MPPTIKVDSASVLTTGHTRPITDLPAVKVGQVVTIGLTDAKAIAMKVIRVDPVEHVFHMVGQNVEVNARGQVL